MGRRRRNCTHVDGILLLDKPAGMTSNQALQDAKHLFHACKAGHTGSLDPIATGLLPLCFGEGTKISQFLLDADKVYISRFRLGVETDTYDSEGQVTATKAVSVSRAEVEKALQQFEGDIEQIPPMYSAVKQGGQALYKLARAGVEVAREPRPVTVYHIKVLAWPADDEVELEVACSKGTYVRALAHDLGQMLGCGAHMSALRRTRVGPLTLEASVTLEKLRDTSPTARRDMLLPIDHALADLPEVTLTALATHYLLQGQPVSMRHSHTPGWVRLYGEELGFLGMGEVLDDGRVAPKRLMRAGANDAGVESRTD